MNKYKNLKFYNNTGRYTNFLYDNILDKWTGRCDFHTISVDLIETYTLYVGETIENDGTYKLNYPIGTTFYTSFDKNIVIDEIFIYNITDDDTLIKESSHEFPISNVSYTGTTFKILNDEDCMSGVLPIHIGFMPSDDATYTSILTIKDSDAHIVAEIEIYGEGEGEDIRLKDMLINIGYDILPEDTVIFNRTDIREDDIDWEIINNKRKELLLEHANIYPFLGSYRAVINILKFYGYQNVRINEYWKNIDAASKYFGTYKQVNIDDIFTESPNLNTSKILSVDVYKKTNKFSLAYDITVATGEYDEFGLPITEEVFTFSPEEVLIKIYALKKKLQSYFLPVNTKIIDIIGEAIFFAQYKQYVVIEQNRIDKISMGLHPKVSFSPDKKVIQDLRPFRVLGFPIGRDLNSGGFTYLYTWKIPISTEISFTTVFQTITLNFNFMEIIDQNPSIYSNSYEFKIDPDNGQFFYSAFNVAEIISNSLNDSILNNYTAQNFWSYPEVIGTDVFVRIVQIKKSNIRYITFDFNEYSTGGTIVRPANVFNSPHIDVSPNGSIGSTGSSMDTYINTIVGYFNNSNIPINRLPDIPEIPVGCPVLLKNDTFNITWDNAEVSFNQLIGFGLGGQIGGHYNWNNLGYYGYHEMQWIVYGPKGYINDSGVAPIPELINWLIEVPYEGQYSVTIYMWDLYNNKVVSTENEFSVTMPNANFIAWTHNNLMDFNWDTPRINSKTDFVHEVNISPITWDEYSSSWDLPFHANENVSMGGISFESLDNSTFYNTQARDTNSLISRHAYKWNNIGKLATWNDVTHLWWEQLGNELIKFKIFDLNTAGPSVNITVSEKNSLNSGTITISGLTGTTANKMKSIAYELNKSTVGLINNFIYYYDPIYNIGHTDVINSISAISKEFDIPKRHIISYVGLTGTTYTYPLNQNNHVGDKLASFEIWEVPTSLIDDPHISINNVSYRIGSTSLFDLYNELIGVTAQHNDAIKNFDFRLISGVGISPTSIKIQAISKSLSHTNIINIVYTGGLKGTLYGRSIVSNLDWNNIRVIQYSDYIKSLTTVNFCYDNCNIHGKKNQTWIITKLDDNEFISVEFNGKLFSYMFNIKGSYSVSLYLEDTNGNNKTITKTCFLNVV